MQDPKMFVPEEVSVPKPKKKKSSSQKPPLFQTQGDSMKRAPEISRPLPTNVTKKVSKRCLTKGVSPLFQQPEKSTSDSLPDLSSTGNEYRALRRKYLLLEEESCGLNRELKAMEEEIRTLEEEKIGLLDELVVLEGLVDPSEFQSEG